MTNEVLSFLTYSSSARGMNSMLTLAKSDPRIAVRPDQFDREPMLLNLANGTLELKTGTLREHRKEDHLTTLSDVVYNPKTTCPTWLRFTDRIFGGDDALIGFIKRFCGYILTGLTAEQYLFIFWGIGANGKSVFINTILSLLGLDLAIKAPTELLMLSQSDRHPTEKADLHGKRFVACVESEEGRKLAESLVKELTGSDRVRARRMRQDFFEFEPTHKIVLVTNHKPAIKGTDHAIWRRIRLVPFNVVIPEKEQDKDLINKLRGELPGILAWAIRGCLEWQREGLETPDAVLNATREYQVDEDMIGAFLVDRCVKGSAYRVRASDVYADYRAWSERAGERPINQRNFGKAMTERGFERVKNNGIWYLGVGLNALAGTNGTIGT